MQGFGHIEGLLVELVQKTNLTPTLYGNFFYWNLKKKVDHLGALHIANKMETEVKTLNT